MKIHLGVWSLRRVSCRRRSRRLRRHTSESTPGPLPRIGVGRSCTRGQSPAQEDRRGWGPSAWSKWTGGLQ